MQLRTLVVTLPLLLPLAATAGQAGPGVEERPAVTAATAAAATQDLSVAVFEQLQQFQSQIETLTGRIEELEHALQQAREQEKARYLDTDARLKQLEQQVAKAAAAAATPAAVDAPAATESTVDGDEKAVYDRARALVREKKFDEAIAVFNQQLKQFPQGELAPSAMYWLGEMWLVAAVPDAAKAGRYFYRVYNEFPKSTWAGTAMYRHGILQCQADETAKGRVTLSKVPLQYPGTQDAKLADAALKQQCK